MLSGGSRISPTKLTWSLSQDSEAVVARMQGLGQNKSGIRGPWSFFEDLIRLDTLVDIGDTFGPKLAREPRR